MSKNIAGVSSLLKGKCQFTAWDYRKVLAEVQKTDLIYLDPPYQGVCGNKDLRYTKAGRETERSPNWSELLNQHY